MNDDLSVLISTAAKKKGVTPTTYIYRAIWAALEKDGITIGPKKAADNMDAWAKQYEKETGEEISFF